MNPANENLNEPIFKAVQICKTFGSTVALDHVDISIYRGQITGLIGENGSGKSTITSIAAGMQPATSGEMYFKGQKHNPSSMIEGAKAGIGMIVQEMGTVPGITIAQNIFLGNEEQFKTFGFINAGKMNKAAKEALDNIGFTGVDPSRYIDELNMQDRKLVEIAKVMYQNPEMLVVDETTTALSQTGREIIYGIMKRMKEENKAVVFISHDLEELMEICDTLTVLRDGKLITTMTKEQMVASEIKKYMVGRKMTDKYYRDDYEDETRDEVVLEIDNITSGKGMLINFSEKVYKGEILGIGGLSHCGMHELGKCIFGDEKILAGSVKHVPSGEIIKNPKQAVSLGFGYVSKDRDTEALVLTASIKDNIVSAGFDKIKNKFGMITNKAEKNYVNKQVEELTIKCASIDQNVQYLSGGNKQKVVFGKWVGRDCDILILDCPTRGVDIGVKAAMYQLIYNMKKQGKTIIMISEELPELIGMSDRLIILRDGQKSGEFKRSRELSEYMVIESMI
ncbi:sugar ABC transporter ATP-binding protein [Clostridium sp. SYSU_GA19001]|uniref:sugar ABC transporter ATP-binding protein n=1 Tax=Clostridium caldaquaticum TaxID=2940653 RepID=UPI002077924B|nr:sugar ABC transporter ATP-binding protein [Clostridium caldaquaticum]MCM8710330.1 sugar ABC transporter ATP-binding protein [Clostridium caldaquaticum]